jgi:RHS repeat-associated protein
LLKVNAGTPQEISITYDGDGQRVSKTVAGVTTKFLVDTNNPTGYAQVVEELSVVSSQLSVTRQYTYGNDLISQRQLIAGNWQTSWYQYDGHGSVRSLTNSAGSVTDTFTYDAFGVLIARTGTTPNLYLHAGEQFDPDLGLYYNRARYLNAGTGRFWTMDSYEGDLNEPLSLHKYLYANSNPANLIDPSGYFSLSELAGTINLYTNLIVLSPITQYALLGIRAFSTIFIAYKLITYDEEFIRDLMASTNGNPTDLIVSEASFLISSTKNLLALRGATAVGTKLFPYGGKINVGGGFETPYATNLNPIVPNTGGPEKNIPNHVKAYGEEMAEIFEAGSAELIVSSRLPASTVDWNRLAKAAQVVLKSKGEIGMNVYLTGNTQTQKLQEILDAFKAAGFKNVRADGFGPSTIVYATKE